MNPDIVRKAGLLVRAIDPQHCHRRRTSGSHETSSANWEIAMETLHAIGWLRWIVGLVTTSYLLAATAGVPPGTSFHLKAALDASAAVSAMVVASRGATLTATGRDGTVYRLTIPPKALPLDTVVTVTPLVAVGGVPGQTSHYGVDLAPAGTQLLELAKLEIEPKSPLPKGVYWLEHTGEPTTPHGTFAFPLDGAKAMAVVHFSGGSVVRAPLAFDDPVDTAPHTHPPWLFSSSDSVAKLQADRNRIEQQYQQDGLDRRTRDYNIAAIDQLLRQQLTQALTDQVLKAQANEAAREGETNDMASRGRLEDLAELSTRLKAAVDAEREAQLLGLPSKIDVVKPIVGYVAALVGKCEEQSVPPRLFIALAHQAAVFGYEISGNDIRRCLCKGADKPKEICSEARGWAINDVRDIAGSRFVTTAKSCESELGPWMIAAEGQGSGGSWSFMMGPFDFHASDISIGPRRTVLNGPGMSSNASGTTQARLVRSPGSLAIELISLENRATTCTVVGCSTNEGGRQPEAPQMQIKPATTECSQ